MRTIEALPQPGVRVLCAVSGGADSMCLLHLAFSRGCDVTAAHFEHGIRGAESLRDAAFVESWCRERGIPFVLGHGDAPGLAEEKGMGLERSDVNMIVTVNPVKKQVLLTSIPRDSYVRLHTAQQMDKLTHTGVYGVDETINTVQDWLGIDLNYYVKMNFTAVRDIINAMGGIRVYSPVAFESSLRGYHYDQGWNELGGREALFFARERHAFEGQDSIRVENQQRVMKAIIEKMTSSTTLLTRYDDIMAAAGDNLSTNMSSDEMTELLKMQITDLATWDIQSQKIEGEYGEDYVASLTQSRKFSVYYTDEESVRKCKENIDSLMDTTLGDLEEASREASRSFVVNFTEMLIEKIKETKGN